MTLNLVEFLRARLDEVERNARAATPGPWEQVPERVGWLSSAEYWHVVDCSGTPAARENAEHIARHDPARALAEVDAKRKLVAAYESAVTAYGAAEVGTAVHDLMTGSVNSLRYALQLHALPYADHPGFKEEWRP